MSGATLPEDVGSLWPGQHGFILRGTKGTLLVVVGQVADVRLDRSGVWMDVDAVGPVGGCIGLDQPFRAFIPVALLVDPAPLPF